MGEPWSRGAGEVKTETEAGTLRAVQAAAAGPFPTVSAAALTSLFFFFPSLTLKTDSHMHEALEIYFESFILFYFISSPAADLGYCQAGSPLRLSASPLLMDYRNYLYFSGRLFRLDTSPSSPLLDRYIRPEYKAVRTLLEEDLGEPVALAYVVREKGTGRRPRHAVFLDYDRSGAG
jgi:hypothetical protein